MFSKIPGSLLIPEGHMGLVGAIQFLGKRFFEDCWTGTDEFKTKIVVPHEHDRDGYDDTRDLLVPVAGGMAHLQTTADPAYLFSEDQDVIDLKGGDGIDSGLTPEERLSEVLKLLRRELVEDQISSHLLFIDGSRREIPDHFWSGEPAMGVLRSGAIDRSTAAIISSSVSLHAPAVRVDAMLTAQNPLADAVVGYLFFLDIDIEAVGGEPASKTKRLTVKAETDCRKWLVGLMEGSPQQPTHTNDELLAEAQSMYPELGMNAFDRAKARAAKNFPAWTKKGRRPNK